MSKGNGGNGDQPDIPEPYQWKCQEKGCTEQGRAATKADANLALRVHMGLMHNKEPKRGKKK